MVDLVELLEECDIVNGVVESKSEVSPENNTQH